MKDIFDAQVAHLVSLGYHRALGIAETALRDALAPLAQHLPLSPSRPARGPEHGHVPFVLVVNTPRIPVRDMLPLAERRALTPVERLYPVEPEQFRPVEGLGIPPGQAYLLLDIDRGAQTLNVTPDDALAQLHTQARSPITVEEGVALLTHFPAFLQPNNCFLMLGSRCGDKRVPALWLSEKRPKLGWCWAGNPHTWLGSASCKSRSPAVALEAALSPRAASPAIAAAARR